MPYGLMRQAVGSPVEDNKVFFAFNYSFSQPSRQLKSAKAEEEERRERREEASWPLFLLSHQFENGQFRGKLLAFPHFSCNRHDFACWCD